VQRGLAVAVDAVGIEPIVVQQGLDSTAVAIEGSERERRAAGVVLGVRVQPAVRAELRDDAGEAALRRHMQRRPPVLTAHVHVDVRVREQLLHHRGVVAGHRHHQRGPAVVVVAEVDVVPGVAQIAHGGHVPCGRGVVKRVTARHEVTLPHRLCSAIAFGRVLWECESGS
jgi:hypothetical protein